MTASAVLFDIDGTLVDSNYLHVYAWQRAFAELDLDVEAWRIHQRIGMDGSELVAELAPGLSDRLADRLKDLNSRFYLETTGLLRVLPGVLKLLDTVAALGLQVVLATSAPEDELAELRKVLGREDVVSAVTSSGDVETAKPRPDIVQVALKRAEVGPQQAVFVGDAVWDIRAASQAGLQCIGLQCGGTDRRLLEAEGAATVYENPADLLEHLVDTSIGRLAERPRPPSLTLGLGHSGSRSGGGTAGAGGARRRRQGAARGVFNKPGTEHVQVAEFDGSAEEVARRFSMNARKERKCHVFTQYRR